MTDNPIPQEVRQFLLKNIDSIAQLEALLLMHNNPETEWSVREVAERLFISDAEVLPLLTRLVEDGFLSTTGSGLLLYQYNPDSVELRQMVDQVTDLYSRFLIPVTNLIHSKPRTRIQEFADAFKLRKDE